MFYFREAELEKLNSFVHDGSHKAMAIYGRRRTGKTELLLEHIRRTENVKHVYFQCTSFDYSTCLEDFKNTLGTLFPEDTIIRSLTTFRDVFTYINNISTTEHVIIIDEFPFLCKKSDSAIIEFQWIIDHALSKCKLILLGSNLSFMRSQLTDSESPLYGRFDEIIEIVPFTFAEIRQLFPEFVDAVDVYAQTGGVAQYVMFFKEYSSVRDATDALFLNKDGRLFQEAQNMLMQEFRDSTTYISILRAISGSEKDSGQIASKTGLDPRGVFAYLNKLMDLGIVRTVDNPLSGKKREKKYRIADNLFRFNYTFIEPNVSMITALGSKSRDFILGDKYSEYLGFVFEDIVRNSCYALALGGTLPFMPTVVGKWWGNVQLSGVWAESEIDLVAYNNTDIVLGECKFRSKQIGVGELESLRAKAASVPVKGRKIHYLLASKSGFTDEVINENVILVNADSL